MSMPTLCEMKAVADLALDQCGVHLDSSKDYLVRSRLTHLRTRLKCADLVDLVKVVKSRPPLLTEFVDAITTNETLFFRDRSPFQALQHKILPEIIDARENALNPRRIRIWSAGCSTGQEAYSIAMTLADMIHDIRDWDITIVGSDVSGAAVEAASRGSYSQWEVERGLPPEQLHQYFVEDSHGWRVRDVLRKLCRFEQRNLTKSFLDMEQFDIVFCRNMAIYFVAAERRRVFERIADSMAEDGCLFVGSTESLVDLGKRFTPQRHCGATLYRPNLVMP